MTCKRILFRLPSLTLIGLLSACAHSLEVVNRDDFTLPQTHGTPRNVAVLTYTGDRDDVVPYELAVEGLRRHPSVGQLRTNWNWNASDPSFRPDIVIDLSPQADFSGSGWNFLITFPGFLLFTPAWHGFVYEAALVTDFSIMDPATRRVWKKESVRTEYSLRHCDFERGFWSSIGWWTPGYGAGSAVTGLFMMMYDSDATSPFYDEVRKPYGDYIAEKIMGPVVTALRTDGTRAIGDVAVE